MNIFCGSAIVIGDGWEDGKGRGWEGEGDGRFKIRQNKA